MNSLLTVKTETTLTPEIREAFEYIRNDACTVRKLDDHTLWWPPEHEILAYSVAVEPDGLPATISVVQARPFYNGMIRLLSRYYAAAGVGRGLRPKWIEDIRNGIRLSTIEMAHQQQNLVHEMGYTDLFMSRAKSDAVMTNLLNLMGPGWQTDSNFYQLCNGPVDCQQRVIWSGNNMLTRADK